MGYGAVSLWVAETAGAPNAPRPAICAYIECGHPAEDSPTATEAPPVKTPANAESDVVMSPASAYRWADLAESEINVNNVDKAKFSVRQALGAAPGNPAILFRAANLYLRLEDYPDALSNLMTVIRNPDLAAYYDRVFALYSSMDLPLDDLLNKGLPHTPEAANAFLRYWVNQNRLEEAEATWTWINQNSLTSLQSAGSYVALLANDSKWDEAVQSWSTYTARLDPSFNRTNWIYNGNFEMKPVDCPFDWHFAPQENVQVTRDKEQMYKGELSLKLEFLGPPKEQEAQAYQMVVLKPGKWMIKAAMKTQSLTGEQGVVIRVVDADDPTRLDVATETFRGTQEWSALSRNFEVGDQTKLVRVEILRPPGTDPKGKVTGRIWIDNVELAPVL